MAFDYEAMKKAVAAATPGPWDRDGIALFGGDDGLAEICLLGNPAQYAGDTAQMLGNYDANARLIAMAPDMAAEIERLRAEVDRLGKAVSFARYGGFVE